MRLWLGIGERIGPFWAGVTLLSTRRSHRGEDYGFGDGWPAPQNISTRAMGCAALFVLACVAVITTLFVAFLVLLL